mmetsp:Transcript_38566/g.120755  ORF Transcript_38566/g.120755 Transcript_38566/m.120755 type:complete len:200 (-) Transcript_38566:1027-1626(-)
MGPHHRGQAEQGHRGAGAEGVLQRALLRPRARHEHIAARRVLPGGAPPPRRRARLLPRALRVLDGEHDVRLAVLHGRPAQQGRRRGAHVRARPVRPAARRRVPGEHAEPRVLRRRLPLGHVHPQRARLALPAGVPHLRAEGSSGALPLQGHRVHRGEHLRTGGVHPGGRRGHHRVCDRLVAHPLRLLHASQGEPSPDPC